MRAHADKLWIAGGALVAVLLFLLTWTLLVMPKNDEAETIRMAVAEADGKADQQRQALKELEADNVNLPAYKAELEKYQNALPATNEFPDLLRSLRELAADHHVEVSALAVAGSTKIEGTTPSIYDMPLTMTVVGDIDDVQGFLNALQQEQARAVLIDSVTVSDDGGSLGAGDATASLALHVFVSGDGPPAVEGQQAVS
ncbi:type 4a pilus biogenesis protein PilO [Catenuloplanes atrovinosus]|uniref:Tfp pilus assembly protein PilO n=1 Tax=Catenuloplanes atrovinosus TaxID=137266 RepID=A0AAE3YLZ4_9ACTN|nr:type 4a pilus biogenesis protein PilO [Catenuloplanes atrovinosus]MDR7274629.1 Tfp pilus assembly protein PilO [Catenuloplanes atrovinosus]